MKLAKIIIDGSMYLMRTEILENLFTKSSNLIDSRCQTGQNFHRNREEYLINFKAWHKTLQYLKFIHYIFALGT